MKSDKLISLLSGGIDSPVASWQMIDIGYDVVLVHFHNYSNTGTAVKDKIMKIAKAISNYQPKTKLYLVPFKEIQTEIIKNIPSKTRMIITRRMMFRIAEKILEKEDAKALITGDNLAQVASQTLENINVIYKSTKYPVLTPLIGSNKDDIIKKAEEIGTYELSIIPYSDCCSFLIDKHPETKAKLEVIEELEKNLKIKELVDKAFSDSETVIC